MGLFKFENRKHVIPAAPQDVLSDVLPAEVSAAIAAAMIHVRTDEGLPAIVQFQGSRSIRFEGTVIDLALRELFPGMNDLQLARARRFLNNRIIEEARRIGEAYSVINSARKRWSATEW